MFKLLLLTFGTFLTGSFLSSRAQAMVAPQANTAIFLGSHLDGESAGTKSNAQGWSLMRIRERDGGALEFQLFIAVRGMKATDLDASFGGNETAIHIHAGGPDETGPILLDVGHYGFVVPRFGGFLLVSHGEITQVQGDHDSGFTPEETVELLLGEQAYFNVHTKDFPAGEIRGQVQFFQ